MGGCHPCGQNEEHIHSQQRYAELSISAYPCVAQRDSPVGVGKLRHKARLGSKSPLCSARKWMGRPPFGAACTEREGRILLSFRRSG